MSIFTRLVPIPGYENLYSITRNGEVYSWTHDKLRKHRATDSGPRVVLSKDGVKYIHTVADLIVKTFISKDKTVRGYKDNDPNNAILSNIMIGDIIYSDKEKIAALVAEIERLNKIIEWRDMQ